MNYIDFLKDLAPFIDKDVAGYFINVAIVILPISSISMLCFCYSGFKNFKKTKNASYLLISLIYAVLGTFGCAICYMVATTPDKSVPKLKEVKIDNKENIEFYKTIIRSPHYQKMDKSDKEAVYASTFNGIVCGAEGCLSNSGEPLLLHKNYALTYAIGRTVSAESVKLNKDFGQVTSLNDVVYQGLDGLSYNGNYYEYDKAFNEFLEKTPKADEAIENAKQAYKNLEATYGSEWK